MVKNNMAETEFERALSTVCFAFKILRLNAYQLTAIKEFVKGNSDVFVNLPTGLYGKSLIYQLLGLEGTPQSH